MTYIFEVIRLVDMYRFYTHLLRIPDVSMFIRPLSELFTDLCAW